MGRAGDAPKRAQQQCSTRPAPVPLAYGSCPPRRRGFALRWWLLSGGPQPSRSQRATCGAA